jgi:putative membrane protein
MKKVFPLLVIMNMWLQPAVSQNSGYMGGGMHNMHFWGAGIIMWILLIVVIVLLIYFVIYILRSNDSKHSYNETALDILKKRYARGEITKEQYDQMKKDL